jgi:hypothetical protein
MTRPTLYRDGFELGLADVDEVGLEDHADMRTVAT